MAHKCMISVGEIASGSVICISSVALLGIIEAMLLECESIEVAISVSRSIYEKAGLMADYQKLTECVRKMNKLNDSMTE